MFTCNRIEKRTADRRIARVGVEWTENRERADNLIFALMLLSVMAGGVVLFIVTGFVKAKLVSAGIGLLLMSAPFWAVRINVKGKPRQLVFERDGRMLAPLGFQTYANWCKSIDGTIADIVSIETRNLAERANGNGSIHTYSVVLAKRDGTIVYVARHLLPDEAHKVAVQLNIALKDLRDDLATAAMKQRPAGKASSRQTSRPTRVEVFID